MTNQGTPPSKNDHSTIDQHKLSKGTLIPPLATIPNLQPTSWIDDFLPEFIWTSLLLSHLRRPDALAVLRKIVKYVAEFQGDDRPYDITHTGLSNLRSPVLDEILDILVEVDEHRRVLRPLLLLDIPSRREWAGKIKDSPSSADWEALMLAVASTLNHQSQESTDCRWVRVLCMMVAGKIILPSKHREMAEEILFYPDRGDQRRVRPTIRSTELVVRQADETIRRWPATYWQQCLRETPCYAIPESRASEHSLEGTDSRVKQLYNLLLEHCNKSRTTTALDPRHDTTFGLALYCLSLVVEMCRNRLSQSISGRIILRTIVECYITLKYLAVKDTYDLWKSYRIFGAGQVKLSYLKLNLQNEKPSYVNTDTLRELANEDIWQEFLPIELGHWANADLRKISIEAGAKDVYDCFYSWTSTFSHGHWGGLRDAEFTLCGNPLHRLHRIPRGSPRSLPDVVPDVCRIVDRILEIVSQCYPAFHHRINVS